MVVDDDSSTEDDFLTQMAHRATDRHDARTQQAQRVTELEKKLATKARAHRRELEAKEEEIGKLQQELKNKEKKIARRDEAIAKRNTVISSVQVSLKS